MAIVRLLAALAVLGHAVVVLLHGGAHTELRVALSVWQKNYVAVVILVSPLLSAVLVWTRYVRSGLLLLAVSMAASLIFGLYYHYVVVSPDNVSYLPPGEAQGLFRLTALLLAATETFGVGVGLLGLRSGQGKV
jgi:hypothetical protein